MNRKEIYEIYQTINKELLEMTEQFNDPAEVMKWRLASSEPRRTPLAQTPEYQQLLVMQQFAGALLHGTLDQSRYDAQQIERMLVDSVQFRTKPFIVETALKG